MRFVIVIATVTVMGQLQSLAQEQSLIDERIAKLEQPLREIEEKYATRDDESRDELSALNKQLHQLLDELHTAGGVSQETIRDFWKSSLAFLFEGQTEVHAQHRRLVAQLVAAQDTPVVRPLKWKIVSAHLKLMVAANVHRDAAGARFGIGFEQIDVYLGALRECAEAEEAFLQSVLQTMPHEVDNVAKRLLAACRLSAALEAYLYSLEIWSNICERLRIGLRGGTPEGEALMRVSVYRWQARVYEARLALEELQ